MKEVSEALITVIMGVEGISRYEAIKFILGQKPFWRNVVKCESGKIKKEFKVSKIER